MLKPSAAYVKTARSTLTKFLVHVACGRGWVPYDGFAIRLWTSGFMDDVMFSRRGATGRINLDVMFRRVRQLDVRTATVIG